MKEMPSFEQHESPEQRLICLLKEKGPEDTETRALLDMWTREQELRVEQDNTPVAVIDLNLRRARLYFAAGYTDEAFENFEAAREQAWNENRQKLYRVIMDEMDKLEDDLE